MNVSTILYRNELTGSERLDIPAKLFGVNFPLLLEPSIYAITGKLALEYHGGYWNMYTLSNGGFYMAPATEQTFQVSSPNGYGGVLSADALGITVCLYAYSQLSFAASEDFAEVCAEQFQMLREYMLDHAEVGVILKMLD